MGLKSYKLPYAFIRDCEECGVDIGEYTDGRLVASAEQYENLRDRAVHYAKGGLDQAPAFIVAAAKRLLTRMDIVKGTDVPDPVPAVGDKIIPMTVGELIAELQKLDPEMATAQKDFAGMFRRGIEFELMELRKDTMEPTMAIRADDPLFKGGEDRLGPPFTALAIW